uniref:Uncharacterized protein n=1 Tax=Arundo donax TaxID=35708 RepID=A0A0A9FLV1_ARUDO
MLFKFCSFLCCCNNVQCLWLQSMMLCQLLHYLCICCYFK